MGDRPGVRVPAGGGRADAVMAAEMEAIPSNVGPEGKGERREPKWPPSTGENDSTLAD